MLYSVSGIASKLDIPQLAINAGGIGYLVTVPSPVWDEIKDGAETTLILYTYVREDRLDLFGFQSKDDRAIFSELLNISGIGPKIALELCSIPKSILFLAVQHDDASNLTKIKGVGRKTAEKLLIDLKQMFEKHPEWSALPGRTSADHAPFDDDAIAALLTLGYDRHSIVKALQKLPPKIMKTEERVTAVLRSL